MKKKNTLLKEQLLKEWQLLSFSEQLKYDGVFDQYCMARMNPQIKGLCETDRNYSKVYDFIKKENQTKHN